MTLLFQAFWTDGRIPCDRTRNALFSVQENKKLAEYLKVDYKCFDFSPEQVIEDAIHIPYPLGVYKRSEKLNRIIRDYEYDNYFSFDSDAFFSEQDYPKVAEQLFYQHKDRLNCFDMAELDANTTEKVVAGEEVNLKESYVDFTYSKQGRKGPFVWNSGGLGGVFLCSRDLIINNGWYDESYTTWGDEDVALYNKIKESGSSILLSKTVFPYHLNHFRDLDNSNYIDDYQRKKHFS